ncbi:MAG: hypothetical protein FD167_331 [bacterium]|nr:MAG: hypothetical protein FD167_331 [bacterium]
MTNLSLSELEGFDPRNKRNRFCCPMCGNDKSIEAKHRSLWVDKNTGVWFCHRCENKGLLLEWQKQSFSSTSTANKQSFNQLNQFNHSNYSYQPKPVDEKKLKQVREEYQGFAKAFAYSPGQHYLSSRGIEPTLAKSSGCGFGYWKHWLNDNGTYTCLKDKRVCFPIRNQAGEIVAMSARAIDNDYLDPKQVVRGYKSLGVFATPEALETDTLVIAEAPIDALSLAMAGFPAVATIGTSWPDWLVNLASRKKLTLIAFDNDEPGDKASSRLLAELSSGGANATRLLPTRKDWNDILLTDGLDSLKSQLNSFNSNGYFPLTNTVYTADSQYYNSLSY